MNKAVADELKKLLGFLSESKLNSCLMIGETQEMRYPISYPKEALM